VYYIFRWGDPPDILTYIKDTNMWATPAVTEMRFGFEVTMYVMNK